MEEIYSRRHLRPERSKALTPREILDPDIVKDARKHCRVCKGEGWHWGWTQYGGNPVKLRCPCVDVARSRKKEPVADARSVIARIVNMRDAETILEELYSAGFRVVGPGELDAVTLEKAAGRADTWSSPEILELAAEDMSLEKISTGASVAKGISASIRALKSTLY